MLTDVQVINLGLSKIASSRISRIDPARTPIEIFMAAGYPQWKRSELSKRRWVFAIEKDYALTQVAVLTDVEKKYKYAVPIDCLRPIRNKRTEWEQRGKFIYSAYSTLKIDYIRNAPESDWDTLFNDVVAARVAVESAEYVTQSTSKKEAALTLYDMAIRDASKANAFTIGPEDIDSDADAGYSWLEGRHYG